MTEPAPAIEGLTYIRLLGSGGYSQVHLYQQQFPRRQVAVKVLKRAGMGDALRAQLTAEANAMAGLSDHPNIVPVFTAGVTPEGSPYIVMMCYPRPNLGARAANERLSVAEVLRIGIQIGSAVETAHRAGILHRDIKPANILTSQYGATGLTDFGIAAQMQHVDEDDDAGVSVPWSPPEVLYATEPASVRSDVYSLAATLWHVLTGRSPFEVVNGDNSPFALMRRIRDNPVPDTGRADVPDSLERLLRQAMAKDPRTRPATAMDLARSLQLIEAQLSLPRTDIIVMTDNVVDDLEPAAASPWAPPEEPTRQRTITPVAGQQPPPASAALAGGLTGRRLPPDWDVPTRDRAALTPAELARTSGGPAESESRSRGLVVAGLVAVVAAVAIIGAIVMFSGKKGPNKPLGTTTNSVTDTDVVVIGPPGVPQLTGTRTQGGKVVVFTWTYDNSLPTDTFRWRETRGSQRAGGPLTKPTLSIPAAPSGATCVQILIVRQDGSNAGTNYSNEKCVP